MHSDADLFTDQNLYVWAGLTHALLRKLIGLFDCDSGDNLLLLVQ